MVAWELLQCSGVRPNGRSCCRLLAQVDLAPGSRLRIKCRSCGAYTDYVKQDYRQQPMVTTMVSSFASVSGSR